LRASPAVDPRGAPTANYGWTKPTIGGDLNTWGTELNADLDGIDSTVHGVATNFSATTPAMDGTAAAGSATTFAHSDHIHPTDTTRAPIASPAFTGVPTTASTPAPGDSTTKLATTAFVGAALSGAVFSNPNRIDNGDMYVNQRGYTPGSGNAVTVAAAWMLDRWLVYSTKITKWNWGINYPYSPPAGFEYCQGVQALTAVAAAAADGNVIQQGILRDSYADLGWGGVSPQSITISFWVISSVTGTFSLAVTNNNSPSFRSYVTTYSIPTANAWTRIVITVPGDTDTSWVNATAMYVDFDLGSGSTSNTATTNVWQSTTTATRATSSVILSNTSGAKWAFTGVKLELGSIATPFVFEPLAVRYGRCQAYYMVGQILAGFNAGAGSYVAASAMHTPMIDVATLTMNSNGSSNVTSQTLSDSGIAFGCQGTATATGQAVINVIFTASVEI
jgi:hypothetical protein